MRTTTTRRVAAVLVALTLPTAAVAVVRPDGAGTQVRATVELFVEELEFDQGSVDR
jgi:hypothetical protein